MSYAHTQRRKVIKKFKKKSERSWYKLFRASVDEIKREMEGPPIGTLEDILNLRRELKLKEGLSDVVFPLVNVVQVDPPTGQ